MTKSGKYYLMQHIHTRRIILRCVRIQRKSWMSLEGREEWDPGSSLASRLAGMSRWSFGLVVKSGTSKKYMIWVTVYISICELVPWCPSMMPIHDATSPWPGPRLLLLLWTACLNPAKGLTWLLTRDVQITLCLPWPWESQTTSRCGLRSQRKPI